MGDTRTQILKFVSGPVEDAKGFTINVYFFIFFWTLLFFFFFFYKPKIYGYGWTVFLGVFMIFFNIGMLYINCF